MFKNLINSVFPSIATNKGVSPDYTAFERTRATPTEPQQATAFNKKAIPKAGPFYDYLFGDTYSESGDDDLSLFVANKIDEIILQPAHLLEDLPVMPGSVATVINLLDNKDFDVNELLRVIEQEPSMAADMVKLANSSKYKRGDKAVTDLQRAFMCMGAEGLRNGVVDVFLRKFSPSPSLYFKQFGEKIWQHSQYSALTSQNLAQRYLPESEANTVYLVGLLRNLGTMVIFQLMTEAFKYVDPDAHPSSASFKWLMAKRSVDLTVAIAQHWQLPPKIVQLLAAQGKDNKEQFPGALCVFEGNIIGEAKSLFDSGRIGSEGYQKYIDIKLQRQQSKDFAGSLIEVEEKS